MKKPNRAKRLSVYKTALQLLLKPIEKYGDMTTNLGLCMLLRCIELDVHWESRLYFFEQTPLYYPEFGEYYNDKNVTYFNLYVKNSHKWRIKILKEIIAEMENVDKFPTKKLVKKK